MKFKFYIWLLGIIALSLSCNDPASEELQYIELDMVRSYFPVQYQDDKSVLFIDESNNELVLHVNYQERKSTQELPENDDVNTVIFGGAYVNDELTDIRPYIDPILINGFQSNDLDMEIRFNTNEVKTFDELEMASFDTSLT